MSDNPKHRRDGVPLDGAPDLGLYTTPIPEAPAPVTTSSWSSDPAEYVAPSPVPPEYPAPPTVSEYRYAAAEELPDAPQPDPGAGAFEQFGENPDTESAG